MRYSIAALALAGAAVAMPSRLHARDQVVQEVDVVQDVQWVTDVVTVTGSPSPAPTPVAAQPTPAAASTFVQVVTVVGGAPAAASPAAASPPAASPAAASPAPAAAEPARNGQADAPAAKAQVAVPAASSSSVAPAASSAAVSDSNTPESMLAVANQWRSTYKLGSFTWNDELASNALKTGTDDGGSDEKHELNTISMAQVITPGISSCSQGTGCGGLPSSFELAYLAGWLCEAPKAGLSSCNTYTSAGHLDLSSGETGHADILNNPDYTKIGCAFAKNPSAASGAQWTGLWICDLA